MNPKVKQYFEEQAQDRKDLLYKLRDLIFNIFPNIQEDFQWGVPIYDNGRYYLANLKKQINFGFSIVGLEPNEIELFEGSGKTARHIKVYGLDTDTKEKLISLMKLVKQNASIPPK